MNRIIFGFTTLVTLVESRFENAHKKQLTNLSVFTLEDTKDPWVDHLENY